MSQHCPNCQMILWLDPDTCTLPIYLCEERFVWKSFGTWSKPVYEAGSWCFLTIQDLDDYVQCVERDWKYIASRPGWFGHRLKEWVETQSSFSLRMHLYIV